MSLFKNSKIQKLKILSVSLFLSFLLIIFLSYNYSEAAIISKTNTANTTLNTGLVAWYTFDGGTVAAGTITDRTGITGSGNKIGGVTVGTGKIGQALKFDGIDDAAYIPNTSSISFVSTTSSFTLSAWVKTATDGGRIIAHYEGNPFWILAIGSDGGANKAYFGIRGEGGGQSIASSISNATDNKWHLITGVRNVVTDQIYLYFDGVRQATTADSSIGDFGQTYGPLLGCHGYTTCSAQWFKGLMDDARIYNRALSSVEVAELYKQGGNKISKTDTTKPTLKTGLVGHWTFDGKDVTANTTTDRSGQGNDGKRIGTAITTGKIGQALKFNGTTDSVTATLNGFPAGATSDVTVSFWAKPQNTNAQQTFFLVAQTDEGLNRFGITLPYDDVIYWDFGGTSGASRLQVTMNPAWYQSMAYWTFTSQTGVGQKIYRNGIIVASDGDVGVFTRGTKFLNFGGFAASSYSWKGIMDDLRIYSRALSTVEIQQLYTQGGGKINKTDLIRAQLRNGLVGHWTFDGKDSTATAITDKSGSGNNELRTGSTGLVIGKIGQAMRFYGTDSYVSTTDSAALRMTSAITLSTWVKSMGANGSAGLMYKGSFAGEQGDYQLLDVGGVLYVDFNGTTQRLVSLGALAMPIGKWVHVAATYDGTSMKLYVNGTQKSATCTIGTCTGFAINTSVSKFIIGGYYNNVSLFTGLMDDARVYNRALTPAEMVELYRMGR